MIRHQTGKKAESRSRRERLDEFARGSISVLLVIVLVPIVSVAGLFVDASRYQLARSEVAAAADLTLNTALSDYDSVLKDVYGLFALTQSSGDLQTRLRSYFTDMLVDAGVASDGEDAESNELLKNMLDAGTGETANLLALSMADDDSAFELKGASGSSLANSKVLKDQIVEFEKYRAPVNAAFSVLEGIKSISKTTQQMKVTQSAAEVDERIEDLNKACKELWKKVKEYEGMDKSALREGGSYGGKLYSRWYADTIVPAAIADLLIVDPLPEAQVKRNGSALSGFTAMYTHEVAARPLMAEVTMGSNGRPLRASAVSEESDLENECRAIESLMETGAESRWLRQIIMAGGVASMSVVDEMQYIETYFGYMRDAVRLGQFYQAYLKKIDADKRDEFKKSDIGKKIQDRLEEAVACTDKMRSEMSAFNDEVSYANETLIVVTNDFKSKKAAIQNLYTVLDKAVDLAGQIQEKVSSATSANESLNSAIGNYGEKDSFSSQMKSAYEGNKATIDQASYQKFCTRLQDLRGHVATYKAYFESLQFMGWGLDSYTDLYKLKARFDTYRVSGNGPTAHAFFTDSVREGLDYLVDIAMTWWQSSPPDGGSLPKMDNLSLSDESFYKYLKQTFDDDDNDEKAKSEKQTRNDLSDNAKSKMKSANAVNGVNDVSISSIIGEKSADSGASTSVDSKDVNSSGYSAMLGNMTSLTSQITSGIQAALTASRDNLYVTDYVFNMFSWYTQPAELAQDAQGGEVKVETATGVPINDANNALYGAEVEYVLYGKDQAVENVKAAKTWIFVIRFACNCVYALTDGEINSETLTPALAIQAASGGVIPYKIPQMVMKIALAIAESAADMYQLMEGKSVPIIKDETTWKMSISGGINAAKDWAVQAGTTLIERTGDQLKSSLTSLLDTAGGKATESVTKLTDQISSAARQQANQVVDGVFSTFSESVLLSVNRLSTHLTESADSVAQSIVDSADASARSFIEQQASGSVKTALQTAYDTFITKNKESIKSEISSSLKTLQDDANAKASSVIDGLQDKIKKAIDGQIGSAQDKVNEAIASEITNLTDDISGKLSDGIDNATEEAKKAAADSINSWFDERFSGYTGTKGASNGSSGVSAGFASCLKFKYSDYLKVFLFIKLCANSDDQVERIGNLIMANIRHAGEDSALSHKAGENFALSEAYTYCTLKATVGLRTMFLSMPLVTQSMGVDEYPSYKLEYYGAQGY